MTYGVMVILASVAAALILLTGISVTAIGVAHKWRTASEKWQEAARKWQSSSKDWQEAAEKWKRLAESRRP